MTLKTYDDGRYMDLRTVLPNGEEIVTRWKPGEQFYTATNRPPSMACLEQADYHREKVRVALGVAGAAR